METLYIPILFLLCHLVGEYIAQSDWMAMNKSKKTWPCLVHSICYTACFLPLTTSGPVFLFIGITHFILDRWPIIVKRLIWMKNHFPKGYVPFEYCNTTGYYDDSPYNTKKALAGHEIETIYGTPRHFCITAWLYIIADNTIHLICNLIALLYLS